jgi:L-alanine-DL-glutamate epimerase-like enolase superfamily enzyme
VVAALNAAIASVAGAGIAGMAGEWIERFRQHLTVTPGALSALATALLDAEARCEGVPLFRKLGAEAGVPVLLSRATDISLPILPPDEAGIRAGEAAADGFRAIKIKVGGGSALEDAARVRAIAHAAPEVTLRLDGNQGFTPEAAVDFFAGLSDLLPRIELFEQPTKAGDDAAMGFVARRLPVPVFADESVHTPEDARRLVGSGSCAGVVLKLAKADPLTAMAIGREAYRAGGTCLFGCMMETHIAVAAALHVAVALGSEIVPMLDLDGHLLTNDAGLVRGGFTQVGDLLTIAGDAAGLGITLP